MAISFVAAGAWIADTSAATPVRPTGHATDDLLLLLAASRPYNTVPTQNAYTIRGTYFTGNNAATGIDVGDVRLTVASRLAVSNAEPAVTFTAGNTTMACVQAFRCAAGRTFDVTPGGNGKTTTGTALSVVSNTTINWTVGDMVVGVIALPMDTTIASPAISIPGITLSAVTVSTPNLVTTTGNDGAASTFRATVTAGTANATPTITATIGAATTATVSVVRIREVDYAPYVAVNDTFTRADSTTGLGIATTGQTWTNLFATWGIQANQAYPTTATDSATAQVYVGSADMHVSTKVTGIASGMFPSVQARTGGVIDYWSAQINAGTAANNHTLVFLRGFNGVNTQIGTSVAGAVVDGDTIQVRAVGNAISVFVNGVASGMSTSDAALNTRRWASLRFGTSTATTTPRWDDFLAIDPNAGTPAATVRFRRVGKFVF